MLFEYSQELYENHPRWQITLSDGRTVYQGLDAGQSWKDLRNYLLENPQLKIVKMFIGFRDNTVALPDNAEGYFFRCSIIATYNWSKRSYIIGILKDGVLELDKWELPEMIYCQHEQRDPSTAEESLILC